MSATSKSRLFSPLTIRGVTLKNRIAVAPMGQISSEDGMVDDWHLVHYGSFAKGGAGLIVAEATAVEERGKITPGCSGLWKDEQILPWKRVTDFLKSQGAVAGIQLSHGGRKAIPEANSIIGPSPIPFGDQKTKVPKEATFEDIEEIKRAWVSAAKRAVKAGFQVIELHFAHGYLVSSFLSPVTNLRKDKYGGSLENRMRLGMEIAEDIRKALPENIVIGVRVSVTDYAEGGWDVQQTIEFAKQLKKIGIDFIDVSSGGVISNVDYFSLNAPRTQWNGAKAVQKEAGIASGIVGTINDPIMAEKFLQDGWATIVFIGRAFLNNPHWPYLAADVLADETSFEYPKQYDIGIGWKAFNKWRKNIFHAKDNK